MIQNLLRFLVVLLPWPLRRRVLGWIYGYEIHRTARIGCSWIYPAKLVMAPGARIGHLNVAIHLDRLELGTNAIIERGNWITAYEKDGPRHFTHLANRDPSLRLGAHGAITKHHHLDCTDRIDIGAFTTVAGYGSQFLTHSIDLESNRQDAAPISIGDYCFVGTAVVVLGGAKLPDKCVLGAKALLNKSYDTPGFLYAGVPAIALQAVAKDARYFSRACGFVT